MDHRSVRIAGLNDIPKIMGMADILFKDSSYNVLSYNPDRTRTMLEKFIVENGKDYMVLVSYEGDEIVGVVCAYAFQPLFSNDKVAVECLLWITEEYRTPARASDLLDAYEYWAKLVGCKLVQYGLLSSADSRLGKLYERRGCKFGESVYYKLIGE